MSVPRRLAGGLALVALLAAACSRGATTATAPPPTSARAPARVAVARPRPTTTTARPTTTRAAARRPVPVTTTTRPTTGAPPITTTTTTTTATSAPPTTLVSEPVAPPAPGASEPLVVLGRIDIPRLGLSDQLLDGITLSTLNHGPGHWPGTALPGHVGNVVIAAHRVSHSRPFRHLNWLRAGDQVLLTAGGRQYTYVVTGHEIVTPDAIRIIDQTRAPTATLFACHPPGSTAYRWVVHLALVG
jgi:sortase A